MLEHLQILAFEIGKSCDMAKEHKECPVNVIDRFNGKDYHLSVDKIIETCHKAKNLGFDGYIAYHRYNEPLLYFPKIRDCIRSLENFKHLLWTNGNWLTEENCEYFDCIHVTNYRNHNLQPLMDKFPDVEWHVRKIQLDDRLNSYESPSRSGNVVCLRPEYIELPIDHAGNICLCCYDYAAKSSLGNIFEEDFVDIINNRYSEVIKSLTGQGNHPDICSKCKFRYSSKSIW